MASVSTEFRAAIDFLLLVHGHGCEDFEGMCCVNLSDHSQSIHNQLADLRKNLNAIQVESGLTDWLKHLGISGWLADLVRQVITMFIMVVVVLLIFSCALQCIKKLTAKMMQGIWMAQKQKGGSVGYLENHGHVLSPPDTLSLTLDSL